MKRVSKSLHFELSEYASLLRALRTKDTMDLTVHLTKKSPFHTKRDHHWTRWPLLLQDVPIPEWSLEDEIAVIASKATRQNLDFTTSQGPLEFDDPSLTDYVINTDFEEDDPDHRSHVPYLTSIIASLLSTIFSLLAKHTPSRPASMQNRIQPLNWRSVIDIIVAANLPEYSNTKILENVIKRMENIYGASPTTYRAVDRIKIKQAGNDKLRKLHQNSMDSFFSQASPPSYKSPLPTPRPQSPKRKRDHKLSAGERNYKARKRWVPKHDRDPHNAESQAVSGHSQEPVRRSTRARSKTTVLLEDDTMEE